MTYVQTLCKVEWRYVMICPPCFKSQETFAPLPSSEGPAFVYVAPEVVNDGPIAPGMETLAARG